MSVVLLDTSCWVEVLRVDGNPLIQENVSELLLEDQVIWCDMVLVELWNSVRGSKERKILKEFERVLRRLSVDVAVWAKAKTLAQTCRLRGLTIPATDLIVAACTMENKVELWHCDKHFTRIPGLKQKFLG